MQLIVSDTSVLIDIEQGELTNAMFSLPWQFAVPDILFFSELAERHSHLLQLGLINKTLNRDLVAEAYLLHQKYIRPSVNDMLALTLAKHEGYQLLTGDKALREVATELNIEVHGTIWLVEQMIQIYRTNRGTSAKAIVAKLWQTVSGMDAIFLYISLAGSSLREGRFTDLVRKRRISNGRRSNPEDLQQ